MKCSKLTNEGRHKISSQSPIEHGHFMKTQPRLDDPADKVTPCGVFTKSRDHKDAQLIYKLVPMTKMGTISASARI